MTGKVYEPGPKSTISAMFGLVMIVVALLIALPVAVNFPESMSGAIVAIVTGGIGLALVAAHIKRLRRAQSANRSRETRGNAF
jgi:hypothetical protein